MPALLNFTIAKLGGSLLDLPDLPRRISLLLDQFDVNPAVIVVGGGEIAERVRLWQRMHKFSDDVAHDLAIEAMNLNAGLLVASDDRLQLVENSSEAMELSDHAVGVLNVSAAIRRLEETLPPLPRSWDMTSDSIAAWFATAWSCGRLLMLKSVELPAGQVRCELPALSEAGFVDHCFPEYATGLNELLWCNVRAKMPSLRKLPLDS